jgi:hypothetical protein
MMESMIFEVNFELMIIKAETYVEKMTKFVYMKNKLTLLVDSLLVERMKQFFAHQLSNRNVANSATYDIDADEFIAKFGGLLSGFETHSDAQIQELVHQERLKKHS